MGIACGAHTAVRTFRTAVFFLVLVLPVSAQEPGQAYTVRVQSVIDGSTYDVRVSEGQSFTIRLWGTNAPETSQPCGTDATARARKFLAVYPRVCGATGMADPDEEATDFSFDDLLEILAELQVEIEHIEEGKEVLEALDPPPAWDVTEVDSVLAGFVLRLETAPGHIDKGMTVYFEDDSRAYVINHEMAFDELMSAVNLPEPAMRGDGGDEEMSFSR